jgi:hypothetical protein
LHRVRASFGYDLGDPVGLIGGHVGDQGAAVGSEQVEELPQRRPVSARCCPQQSAGVVVDHDGDVAVAALVGDLVDADAAQPVQAVAEGFDVGPDPGDDRADGAPGDPHQLGHRGLGTLRDQPCHRLVEAEGVPGTMSRPRHVRDYDAVLAAGHPRRLGLHEHLHRREVQSPPPAPTLASVITTAAPTTDPAPGARRQHRPDVNDEDLPILFELHVLDDRLLDAQQGAP